MERGGPSSRRVMDMKIQSASAAAPKRVPIRSALLGGFLGSTVAGLVLFLITGDVIWWLVVLGVFVIAEAIVIYLSVRGNVTNRGLIRGVLIFAAIVGAGTLVFFVVRGVLSAEASIS